MIFQYSCKALSRLYIQYVYKKVDLSAEDSRNKDAASNVYEQLCVHSGREVWGYGQDSPGPRYRIDSGDSKDIENQTGKSTNLSI